MRLRTALRVAGVAVLGLWLAACAAEPGRTSSPEVAEQRQIVAAIRRYYESNAAEENNACSAPIMSAVTRTEVVSDSDGQLVVDVTYAYGNYVNRSGRRCRGFGSRQFTLTRAADGFQVVEMTGERRLGARWRIW
ncbi:MAG: hypothetical protein ACREJ0_11350 [Geminicoccaceae bacterium]